MAVATCFDLENVRLVRSTRHTSLVNVANNADHEAAALNTLPLPDVRSSEPLLSLCEKHPYCVIENIRLIPDCGSALVRDAAFDSARLEYSGSHHKKQDQSAALQTHLSSVADLGDHFVGKEMLI